MEDPRYRWQPKPLALNQRRRRMQAAYIPLLWIGAALLVFSMIVMWPSTPDDVQSEPAAADPPVMPSPLVAKLADSWLETATAKLDQKRPAEALALLVTALRTNPAAEDARALAESLLRGTVWHFPDLEMHHPLPVVRIAVSAGDSSLWVGMGGDWCTVARWDLESPVVASVLFPLPGAVPRSLVVDPTARRLVIERAGVLLLCDARTLKPVADLGSLPQSLTPESVIAFSPDGLLFAHPAPDADGGPAVWLLRDAETGQILRRHQPSSGEASDMRRPLAAHLDRRLLRVLHEDGVVVSIPVSPVEPVSTQQPAEPMSMLYARFAADGRSWLAVMDRGPHQAPVLARMPEDATRGMAELSREIMMRFPWSRQPGIWSGLLRDPAHAPLHVVEDKLVFNDSEVAPMLAPAAIHAVAHFGKSVLLGCKDGSVTRFRLLAKPGTIDGDGPANVRTDAAAVAAFGHLAAALCGTTYDEDRCQHVTLAAGQRISAARECDPAALARLFPRLDFTNVLAGLHAITPRVATDAAMRPLHERLSRADPRNDPADPAVTAFAQALENSRPDDIASSLEKVQDPPPLLRRLAESRIAWLEDRKMDAIALWPALFPDYRRIRLTEDWDGWEQPDFGRLMDDFRKHVENELASLKLADDASPEQRDELFERLTDPETARALGRPRLAGICLEAARAFSVYADEAERTLALAMIAYNFGADPAPSLRALAHAQAALGHFDQAHARWIELITGQPVEEHLPADYAEAAYTAFETANPSQAMEILLTGMRRFPRDSDFALRAGWIALLAGDPQRAYRFLLTGKESGFPEDKVEHATVLLAIAAAQSGEVFDAGTFHEELTTMNPAWSEPATIEELNWPEELKATLRQLTW